MISYHYNMTHRKRSIHISHEHGDTVHTSTSTLSNSYSMKSAYGMRESVSFARFQRAQMRVFVPQCIFRERAFIPLFIPHTSTLSSPYNNRQPLQRTQLPQAMFDHPEFYQQMYPHLHTADMPPAPPPSPAPQEATTGYLQFYSTISNTNHITV
jgi:hypothetical protein